MYWNGNFLSMTCPDHFKVVLWSKKKLVYKKDDKNYFHTSAFIEIETDIKLLKQVPKIGTKLIKFQLINFFIDR